jgi:drug/metabolite transporter (DMT)-like permease
MNLAPDLPASLAVGMSLLAAFLWGTWFISLKYLGDHPVDGFLAVLFTTSVVFVWAAGLALDGPALAGNIAAVWRTDPSRIWVTLLCGALYVTGMRLSMTVLATIGLSLTQPIQSSIYILAGSVMLFKS